ncbi:MAG: tripartite tricarboxylate transporter permease, partial [Candidatus Thermoplasmatota archaeon]|nr:tripartite tricarboxylate transporter permease [Candidatus Thermoplasmatota archaeon]
MNFYLLCILVAIAGTLVAAVISCILPGLHVYNVMGFVVLFYLPVMDSIEPFLMLMFLAGMVTGFGLLFTISSQYFSAPDDTTAFYFMPTQKYLMDGRGHESAMLAGIGGLIGIFGLVLVLPFSMHFLQMLRELVSPHTHWLLGSIMAFLLISEWPREYGRGKIHLFSIGKEHISLLDSGRIPPILKILLLEKRINLGNNAALSKPRSYEWEILDGRRLIIIHRISEKNAEAGMELMVLMRTSKWIRIGEAYKSKAAGWLTFGLASWLGMLVFFKTLVPPERAFQTLMPVFVGLFSVSAIILALISKVKIPKQHLAKSYDIKGVTIAQSGGSGFLSGMFAAFVPAVTPGISATLGGNATGLRDDKVFIITGGVNRVVYYVGALCLFLLPLLHLRRGGMAINVNLFFVPQTVEQYLIITAAVAICGFIAFILLLFTSKFIAKVVEKFSYQTLNL